MVKYRDVLSYQQKIEYRRKLLSAARSMADSMGGYDSEKWKTTAFTRKRGALHDEEPLSVHTISVN